MRIVRVLAALAAVALLVAVDIRTKTWASSELRHQGPRVWAGGHIELAYRENTGIAFGLLRGAPHPLRRPLILGYSITASAVVGLLLMRRLLRPRTGAGVTTAGLCALLAGTLGNLHDRLERGWVIDFIDYSASGRVNWPAFNLADVCIAAGIILCAVGLLLSVMGIGGDSGRRAAPARAT